NGRSVRWPPIIGSQNHTGGGVIRGTETPTAFRSKINSETGIEAASCSPQRRPALVDDEDIAFFMADAFETGDAAYIAKALGVVARAKGMTEIAKKAGLSREQLYRSFSERGNPTLKTTLAVMRALGIDMTAKPHGRA